MRPNFQRYRGALENGLDFDSSYYEVVEKLGPHWRDMFKKAAKSFPESFPERLISWERAGVGIFFLTKGELLMEIIEFYVFEKRNIPEFLIDAEKLR